VGHSHPHRTPFASGNHCRTNNASAELTICDPPSPVSHGTQISLAGKIDSSTHRSSTEQTRNGRLASNPVFPQTTTTKHRGEYAAYHSRPRRVNSHMARVPLSPPHHHKITGMQAIFLAVPHDPCQATLCNLSNHTTPTPIQHRPRSLIPQNSAKAGRPALARMGRIRPRPARHKDPPSQLIPYSDMPSSIMIASTCPIWSKARHLHLPVIAAIGPNSAVTAQLAVISGRNHLTGTPVRTGTLQSYFHATDRLAITRHKAIPGHQAPRRIV